MTAKQPQEKMNKIAESPAPKQQNLSRVPPQLREHVFKPGESGNPAGKPVGRTITDAVKSLLHEKPPGKDETYLDLIARRFVLNVVGGKEKSLEMILDRTEGKVKEHVVNEMQGIVGTVPLSQSRNRKLVDTFKKAIMKQLTAEDAYENIKKLGDE